MTFARKNAGWVYFVKPTNADGPVKIGHSGVPINRLAMLRSWSPIPLEIVALLPAPPEVEARLHAKFYESRSHGEWFHPTAEMAAVIASIAADCFDAESLPAPRDIRNKSGAIGDGLGHLAGSLTKSIESVRKMGVAVPVEVRAAKDRFCCCRERATHDRDLSDALVIADFLASHFMLTNFARRELATRGVGLGAA
jgi:hypothetical protein